MKLLIHYSFLWNKQYTVVIIIIDIYINRLHGSFIAPVVNVNISDCLMSVRLLVLKQNTQICDIWVLNKSSLMINSQHLSQSILD